MAPPKKANKSQAAVIEHCLEYGIKTKEEGGIILTEISGQDSLDAFINGKDVPLNFEKADQFYSDSNYDKNWRGGTFKQIVDSAGGKFDIEPFLKQKEALKKTIGNLEFLEAELARKRTRIMSEYDGELDLERLYEREPFHNTRITNNGVARTMDVNVMFQFSAGVDSKQINEYGAMTWAVVDILEKAGIRCNVVLTSNLARLSRKGGNFADKSHFRIKIKAAEEYIDTMDIARHFTSNYFRRALFYLYTVAHESIGREVEEGLGYPEAYEEERMSKAQKGVLNLTITQMKDFKLDSNALANYIRQAL